MDGSGLHPQGGRFLLWDEGQPPSFGTRSPLVVLKGTVFLTPLAPSAVHLVSDPGGQPALRQGIWKNT